MIFYPSYFAPVAQYVAMTQATEIWFESCDNFQKQTYRNRCCIYGPQGIQSLNIPVLKANSKQPTKDVRIDQSSSWQQQHLKAIAAAYNSSPFYEYFDRELKELFMIKTTFLLDFTLKCHEFIAEALPLELPEYSLTEQYEKECGEPDDFRFLVNAKSNKRFDFSRYVQVFSDRHGFIENLSILDLLFAEGGNTANYLESQTIHP